MNCQQICKISRKDLTEVKIFQKVLGGGQLLFIKTFHTADIHKTGTPVFTGHLQIMASYEI